MSRSSLIDLNPLKTVPLPYVSTCTCVWTIWIILRVRLLARRLCPDGDESFQAYHQDIGRISGSATAAQVAPKTTIVNKERHNEKFIAAQVSDRSSTQATSPQQGARTRHSTGPAAPRKPNRVTLAIRRDHLPLPGAEPTQLQPALIPAQLPAPQAAPLEPTFAPIEPQQVQHQNQPTGPALASFRATGSTISARHSALMAQVAAERAASVGSAPDFGPSEHSSPPQASLGSPIVALSSPSVSQIQPPEQAAPSNFFSSQPQPAPPSSASASSFVNQPDEPLVAPSFEHVVSRGCPAKGVFSYENKDHCDRYYMCTNGTFTEEACPNGLSYSQMGAVYQHCAYNWNVDCGRKKTPEPISSPGCPWQFGIFPIVANGRCSIDYFACEWGVPETKRCTPEGLFYDDRIKGCQWADQLGCKSEALLNFKCPAEDEDNPYWPYPRYYHNTQDVIVCVNEQPRLVHCNEEQLVDPSSLACVDVKKKKF